MYSSDSSFDPVGGRCYDLVAAEAEVQIVTRMKMEVEVGHNGNVLVEVVVAELELDQTVEVGVEVEHQNISRCWTPRSRIPYWILRWMHDLW